VGIVVRLVIKPPSTVDPPYKTTPINSETGVNDRTVFTRAPRTLCVLYVALPTNAIGLFRCDLLFLKASGCKSSGGRASSVIGIYLLALGLYFFVQTPPTLHGLDGKPQCGCRIKPLNHHAPPYRPGAQTVKKRTYADATPKAPNFINGEYVRKIPMAPIGTNHPLPIEVNLSGHSRSDRDRLPPPRLEDLKSGQGPNHRRSAKRRRALAGG